MVPRYRRRPDHCVTRSLPSILCMLDAARPINSLVVIWISSCSIASTLRLALCRYGCWYTMMYSRTGVRSIMSQPLHFTSPGLVSWIFKTLFLPILPSSPHPPRSTSLHQLSSQQATTKPTIGMPLVASMSLHHLHHYIPRWKVPTDAPWMHGTATTSSAEPLTFISLHRVYDLRLQSCCHNSTIHDKTFHLLTTICILNCPESFCHLWDWRAQVGHLLSSRKWGIKSRLTNIISFFTWVILWRVNRILVCRKTGIKGTCFTRMWFLILSFLFFLSHQTHARTRLMRHSNAILHLGRDAYFSWLGTWCFRSCCKCCNRGELSICFRIQLQFALIAWLQKWGMITPKSWISTDTKDTWCQLKQHQLCAHNDSIGCITSITNTVLLCEYVEWHSVIDQFHALKPCGKTPNLPLFKMSTRFKSALLRIAIYSIWSMLYWCCSFQKAECKY